MHLLFSNILIHIEILTFSSKSIFLQWLFYLDYEVPSKSQHEVPAVAWYYYKQLRKKCFYSQI